MFCFRFGTFNWINIMLFFSRAPEQKRERERIHAHSPSHSCSHLYKRCLLPFVFHLFCWCCCFCCYFHCVHCVSIYKISCIRSVSQRARHCSRLMQKHHLTSVKCSLSCRWCRLCLEQTRYMYIFADGSEMNVHKKREAKPHKQNTTRTHTTTLTQWDRGTHLTKQV